MLDPAQAELLKASVLQSIEVLGNNRVMIRSALPGHGDVADIASRGTQRVTGDTAHAAPLTHIVDIAHNHIWTERRIAATADQTSLGYLDCSGTSRRPHIGPHPQQVVLPGHGSEHQR